MCFRSGKELYNLSNPLRKLLQFLGQVLNTTDKNSSKYDVNWRRKYKENEEERINKSRKKWNNKNKRQKKKKISHALVQLCDLFMGIF